MAPVAPLRGDATRAGRRPPAAALTQVAAARAGRGQVRRRRAPGCSSPPTALEQATRTARRRAPGRPAGRRRSPAQRHRPRLRHRRRPGRLRAGRADRRRRRPRPGAGRGRRGQPRRARPGRRGAGRATRTTLDLDGLRRGLRRPGPPRRLGAGSSTPTAGRRRGRSSPGLLDPPLAWSRSPPASRTTWCPTASRRSGSATAARSRRRRSGRRTSPPAGAGPP